MHHLIRNILFLSLLILVTGVMYSFFSTNDSQIQNNFITTEIQRGDVIETVSATGTLNPVTTVKVGSQISGIIKDLNADFNSYVKQGDLIAKIESSLYKARVAQAQANLQSANADFEKASLAVTDTLRTVKRLKSLYADKAITKSDLDAAQFQYESAKVEKNVKQAAILQAKAALAQAEVNLTYTNIHAPIDGMVISRDVDVGQTVAASLQAPTLFTIANDLTQMQIEAEVDEAYIGKIKEGQSVLFSVFAFPKRQFDGTVVQIRLNPKVEAGVVKYNCIIHVENKDMALKPGMTATVAIETQKKTDVYYVNNSALRYVPDWPDEKLATLRRGLNIGEAIIWTLIDKAPEPVKVKRGLVSETGTEIESDNIFAGMKIVAPDKNNKDRPKSRRRMSLF